MYGTAFHTAYHLGEEVADKGTTVVTSAIKDIIATLPSCKGLILTAQSPEDSEHLPGLDGVCYTMSGDVDLGRELKWNLFDNKADLHESEGLAMLCRRHDLSLSHDARDELDIEIAEKYLSPTTIVMMFSLGLHELTHFHGSIKAVQTMNYIVKQLFKTTLAAHGAKYVEPTLYLFQNVLSAVRCAVALSQLLRVHNDAAETTLRVSPGGFGVHVSELIVIPHSDVHWGDAVSTASKLSEDLSEPYQVMLSSKAFSEAGGAEALANAKLTTTTRELSKSGVAFKCYVVEEAAPAPSAMTAA
jgi:class 3 adenylate cyclase